MLARLSLLAMVAALGAIYANGIALPVARATCASNYIVVSGDTCNAIAAKTNVTTSALETANPAIDANCDNLFIGESLCIPAGSTNSTCAQTYTVKSGDVCIAIANQFNITAAQLETANPAIDAACDNLQIGEQLCIP